jgi:hypothetical protein
MDGFIKLITLTVSALLLSGCKLAVMVPSEGNVVSASGLRDCAGPRYCEFDITDDAFSETFTAVPRPGFEFVRWQDGGGFICARSTDASCTVEMPNAIAGAAIVALFHTGLIRPVFTSPEGVDTDGDGMINEIDDDDDNDGTQDAFDNCPLDGPNTDGLGCPYIHEGDAVRVDDKMWAQPALFQGVTWYEINDACPGPAGACSGKLGNYDVTGWTWASGAEVTELFNDFFGTQLGAVPDFVFEPDGRDLSPNFFNYFDGYQEGYDGGTVYGWLRESANVVEGYHYGVDCSYSSTSYCSSFSAGATHNAGSGVYLISKFVSRTSVGVWLHRPVP